jgi:all-trans-8'-apo-beta-carotenal 15,15'-oxygenase
MRSPDPWIHGAREDPSDPGDPCEILARAYRTVRDEVDVDLPVVEGALPVGLEGVYYRNGPGRVEIGGDRYGHPFDGDGMVLRFAIGGGRVRYRNRYVRTRERVDEERAGRVLYRGFATARPGGLARNFLRVRLKNAANTAVIVHAGRLYALWEGGRPHRLDPETLATIGKDDLGGLLVPESPIRRACGLELPFSAHPSVDPRTGELWGFGVDYGLRSRLAIYRIAADGTPIERRFVALPRSAFVHDAVLTEHWVLFVVPPVVFATGRVLLGVATPIASLDRDPISACSILLVPRDGSPPRSLGARPGFAFHHLAGWEEAPRTIVLHSLRRNELELRPIDALDPRSFRQQRPIPAIPTRYRIDLGRGRVDEETWIDADVELPTIDPGRRGRPIRYAWCIARPRGWRAISHPAIARLDLVERSATIRDLSPDLPGEPLFVPRPAARDEDDGWLLTVVYRAREHRSELWILDARDLSTLARAQLPHHVPPGFHGCFVPACTK